jgi:hypothetical protein
MALSKKNVCQYKMALRSAHGTKTHIALPYDTDRALNPAKLFHYRIINISKYHATKLSNYQTIKLSHYQAVKHVTLSNYQAIKLANYQTIELSNYHIISYHLILIYDII